MNEVDLAELTAPLSVIEDGGPSVWEQWMPRLREAAGLEMTLLHDVEERDGHFGLGRAHCAGAPLGDAAFVRGMDEMMQSSGRRWGVYDPRHPELPQQNRILTFPGTDTFRVELEERRELAARFGLFDEATASLALEGFEHAARLFERMRIHQHWQIRALVCEDGELLGWFGGFSREQPSASQRRLLQALVPAVRRRLSLERSLYGAPLWKEALGVTLEALGRPAFLVDSLGHIRHCNHAAQSLLDQRPFAIRSQVRDAATGQTGPHESLPVTGVGLPLHFLVLFNTSQALDLDGRLEECAARWSLTPTERRVLRMVVEGEANKVIAERLGCSPKTVEIHVTHLLRKGGASSRHVLISRFWRRGEAAPAPRATPSGGAS